eukprot:7354153-Karenia_brevis.AAC.1
MSGAGAKTLPQSPMEVASQADEVEGQDVQREEESRQLYESVDVSVEVPYPVDMVAERESSNGDGLPE